MTGSAAGRVGDRAGNMAADTEFCSRRHAGWSAVSADAVQVGTVTDNAGRGQGRCRYSGV